MTTGVLQFCIRSQSASAEYAVHTSSSYLPTKFSQLTILHIFITSSLFNVVTVQVLALHPSLFVTLVNILHRALVLLRHRHHLR